jgi:hypothetical protein
MGTAVPPPAIKTTDEAQGIPVADMPIESISRHLQSGRRLVFVADGSNIGYQFDKLLYEITCVDAAQFKVECYAGQTSRRNLHEYRIWSVRYETLKELIERQPFDLRKFKFVI